MSLRKQVRKGERRQESSLGKQKDEYDAVEEEVAKGGDGDEGLERAVHVTSVSNVHQATAS